MRRTLILVAGALALAVLAVVAILPLMGSGALFDRRPLVARVALAPFTLPASYGIDPAAVAEELVAQMQARVDSDLALRMMLGTEETALMREQAIPRLVNGGVLRRMLEDMPGLGTVVAMQDYRTLAEVEVVNRGEAPLDDVVLVLPGPARAEAAEGREAPLAERQEGLVSVTVGALAPGEAARLVLWLAETPTALAQAPGRVRVGAAGGIDGTVRLYADQRGWNGAELQVLPWARWLAAGLLAVLALGALAAAAVAAGTALRPARRA